MASNVAARDLEIALYPTASPVRSTSPTKVQHDCVWCSGKTTSHVTAHWWGGHHPIGDLYYGLLPSEHPRANNSNLQWRLFSWICCTCKQSWYSYKYCMYLDDEVAPSESDCAPLPLGIFKALPAPPPEPDSDMMMTDTSGYSSSSYPTRSSSLACSAFSDMQSLDCTPYPLDDSNTNSTNPSFYYNASNSSSQDSKTVTKDLHLVPVPDSVALAANALTTEYHSRLACVQAHHHYKHTSNPEFPRSALERLDELADRRRSEPVASLQASYAGSSSVASPYSGGAASPPALMAIAMVHNNNGNSRAYGKRGPSFDSENYREIRKIGACKLCKEKKRKCVPSHLRAPATE